MSSVSSLLPSSSTLSPKKHQSLIQALRNISNITLLLYGPPGTGKTYHLLQACKDLNITLEHIEDPKQFNGHLLFKCRTAYIDTDNINELRYAPLQNVIIESRSISKWSNRSNLIVIRFTGISIFKLRKMLITNDHIDSTVCDRDSRADTDLSRICSNNKVNMHLLKYYHLPVSTATGYSLFHYIGKIFYNKPFCPSSHNIKVIINYLFENYLFFHEYNTPFADNLSYLYHCKCYDSIIDMARSMKSSNVNTFISFRPPANSPINLHYKNEYEELLWMSTNLYISVLT